MNESDTPAKVGSSEWLGPLPEPVAWFRAPYGTLEPNPLFRMSGPQSLDWAVACFTEGQLRAAVAAERELAAVTAARLWRHHAYAALGMQRDMMADEDVATVQRFLGTLEA